MPTSPPASAPRCAVVDLGSNSVRLVVYEGRVRNPLAIFNEKAVLRLGSGLQSTGRLNPVAMEQAVRVLQRYRAVALAMGANPPEVLATAAVREALNGPDFVALLSQRMPDVSIKVLSGPEEAAYAAEGVLCGIPDADGVMADIGGGSLELVALERGERGAAHTLGLGVIRLAERSGGDLARARAIVEDELAAVPWLAGMAGRDLYLVGGAWRALARIRMEQVGYPLRMVHHYALAREEARSFAIEIASMGRRELERLAVAPRRRIDDLPFAATVLRRLLRIALPRRVVFSANGMREGWYMRRMPAALRALDPLLAAGRHYASWLGRDPAAPPALLEWTDPLFPLDSSAGRRLREAVCWMSDIGSRDHPEFRAEQAFLRVLRQPGIGLDHHVRAFLALAVAARYEAPATASYLAPARALLDAASARRAETIGVALRLAYTLSAGTPDLLAATSLSVGGGRLTLVLDEDRGVFAGESVVRRLGRLAQLLGLEAAYEPADRAALWPMRRVG
ncbi:MAG: Ppx/GppA family phosphatase [Acetobacteraceae bacterium]|nr:Ppx/GppA family phosphatase [Acetobacteraceae bacterium]